MNEGGVSIKGTSDGLIIDLGSDSLELVLRDLDDKLGKSASFFRGGRVALRVGSRIMSRDEIESLGMALQRWDVSLWAVESDSPDTRAEAESLGLETEIIAGKPVSVTEPMLRDEDAEALSQDIDASGEALLVKRTLRSGSMLMSPGHLIIIGDVNAGAEIVAGGDIIVWGKLRGLAHAGAGGDDGAIVCALRLIPSQLRIGSKVAVRPPEYKASAETAQLARVDNDSIVIESWMDGVPINIERPQGTVSRAFRRIGNMFRGEDSR